MGETAQYSAFVVPAYVVTAVVFAAMIAGALLHARRWRRRAEDQTPR